MSTHWFFFFTATAPTELYTLSLHDALPIVTGQEPERLHTAVLVAPARERRRLRKQRRQAAAKLQAEQHRTEKAAAKAKAEAERAERRAMTYLPEIGRAHV